MIMPLTCGNVQSSDAPGRVAASALRAVVARLVAPAPRPGHEVAGRDGVARRSPQSAGPVMQRAARTGARRIGLLELLGHPSVGTGQPALLRRAAPCRP